ncbi:S24 family peptidase [Thiothrix sp.]|jgi:repressor LexA|uniref:LexA family protein n=1 Tax=Thiothrix sp. TaxID=1032 RepID=UPI00257D88D4|nr:S24 family peptidase [Thiothrix sp.]
MSEMIITKKGRYTLEFRGETMRGIGIYDGDIVVIDQSAPVKNGDIVVALVNREEVTLKRYYRMGDYVELRAENPTIQPIRYPPNSVEVQGKLIASLREY